MIPYLGDFAEDATVYIPFSTFTSDDPAISSTISEFADADIKVHKDGAATPITTDGATVVINLNSATGAHMITIATNADAAYSTGSEYSVRIEGVTIDGGADIDAWVGSFSVERAGGALAQIKALITTVGTAGAGLGDLGGMSTAMKAEAKTEAAGALTDYDAPTNTEMVAAFTEIKGASWATTDSLEAIRDHASTIKAETALIVADTNELQSDDVPGLIATLDAVVDTVKAETALIVADTNELQGDDVPGLIATLDAVVDTVKAETALIVADTNELQTDNVPGLIATLDAVVDTVKAETVLILADTADIQANYATEAKQDTAQADLDTLTDARGEPGQGAPGVSESMLVKIDYLYKAFRNKSTQTATTYSLMNDDASTVDHKATVSDDATTATKGEIASGP